MSAPGDLTEYFIRPEWPAPSRVKAVTCTRLLPGLSLGAYASCNFGMQAGDDPGAVRKNRGLLAEWLTLPEPPRWLRQCHGSDVVVWGPNGKAAVELPEADAAIAQTGDIVCALLTADCLPILLCDEEGTEIAAIHAGWRGLAQGIVPRTLQKMRSSPNSMMAWLGPAIGPRAFEVGGEVRDAFLALDQSLSQAFSALPGRTWLCDLYGIAAMHLKQSGIGRIYGGQYCTFGDARRFYSYRRDRATGRMATLIWIEPRNGANRIALETAAPRPHRSLGV